ncbi:MAG: hypothetical protein PVI21_00565 [Candidatus Woesebacteria bacterium]|jgi:hypothetical protein
MSGQYGAWDDIRSEIVAELGDGLKSTEADRQLLQRVQEIYLNSPHLLIGDEGEVLRGLADLPNVIIELVNVEGFNIPNVYRVDDADNWFYLGRVGRDRVAVFRSDS